MVGGAAAGVGPGGELLEEKVRAAAKGVPVVCGTGCKKETVAQFEDNCDGAFVGTTFKRTACLAEKPRMDARRVKEFMDTVKTDEERCDEHGHRRWHERDKGRAHR